MGLETALLVGGVASAAGSVGGAAIGAGAAGSAADKQLQANRESIAAQKEAAAKAEAFLREQNSIARADLAPVRDAQVAAIQQLQGLGDPNNAIYQQQRQINTEAIQRQLAAQGLLRSRAQGDQLSQLELGLNQQRLNTLGGLAGLGAVQQLSQGAYGLGNGLANIQQGLGQQIGSAFQQSGQAMGQAALQQGQALQGGLSGFTNSLTGTLSSLGNLNYQRDQQAMQQAQFQQLLNAFGKK